MYFDEEIQREVSTHSMLKSFQRCPKQAQYKYVERLKRKYATAREKPLRRGVWFHELMEVHYAGGDWKIRHRELSTQFSELFDEEKDALGDLPTELANLMRSYLWHYGANKDDPLHGWKVHEVELTIEADLPSGRLYRGRVDMLVEDEYGLWLVDHKCLVPETSVATDQGLSTMGELNIGDLVIGSSGDPIKVIDLNRRILPVYEITLKNGKSFKATGEHKWPTSSNKNAPNQVRIKTTQELLSGSSPTYLVPAPALNYPEIELEINPYVMGALLGDGSFLRKGNQVDFCKNHLPTVERVLKNLPSDAYYTRRQEGTRAASYLISSPQLKNALKAWGLDEHHGRDKFIPEAFFRGSIEQRRQLLFGLMDTDGSSRKGQPLYQTGSEQLARDVARLVESLGGVATLWCNTNTSFQNGKGADCWDILIHFSQEFGCPFLHDVKASRWKPRTKHVHSQLRVESVVLMGDQEVIDIEVDSQDHLFVVNGVLSHNTHKTLPDFTFRLLDYQSALYLWAAHQNKIPVRGFIWNYVRTKVPTTPALVDQNKPVPRLSRAKCDTDYPTLVRALKAYGMNPDPYREWASTLKVQRWVPGEVQTSSFFRRETLEKDEAMIGRALAMANHTDERMHTYDFKNVEAVERIVDRSCNWFCDFRDLCTTELFGGNAEAIRRQQFKMEDPLSYYRDKKDESSSDA